MLAFLARRKDTTVTDTTTDETPAQPTKDDDNVLIRFLTVGGATVEVYPTRFVTRWAGGPPFAAAQPHEIDGFQWKCTGCRAYGREGETYQDRNFRQESEARTEANEHAAACRAMPKPTA